MTFDPNTPYVFVDLETTGTSPKQHRVIEVGIVRVEHGKVVREYRTFLDPGEPVPAFISSLTGIHSAMLVDAPQFEEVALEIAELLEGALFVAHNAMFDYNFLAMEFRRLGMQFSYAYLCTAKLSRKLYPKLRGHSVDALVARFALDAGMRHRALDDARVLHQFLEVSRTTLGADVVDVAIRDLVRIRRLPMHVKEHMLTRLPESPGVYFFYGKQDELLYVGKSRRIRTRVRSHFTKDGLSGRGQDMLSEIHRIDHVETGGELGALILEAHLIKERSPVYNVRERERYTLCVARQDEGVSGHAIVKLEYANTIPRGQENTVLSIYKTKQQAREQLSLLAKEYALCPYLLDLEQHAPCFAHQLDGCQGACVGKEKPRHYNKRFDAAFTSRRLRTWPFAGPVGIEERSVDGTGELFIVDNWRLLAALHYEGGEWQEFVPACFQFEYDIYKILARELTRRNVKVVVRELTSSEEYEFLGTRIARV